MMDLERFRRLPLMGIVRGVDIAVVEPLVETVIAAGLETLEITLNTAGAPAMIARARAVAGDRLVVGAGTVVDIAGLVAALASGAQFIVSPVLVPDVVGECRWRGIPVFPGALTPSEIFAAAAAGAAMVKVFPASVFGPGYFREIHGPMADVELLACGGIRASNAGEYLAAGAATLAFGGSVFAPARLAAGDFAAVGRDVAALVAACREAGSSHSRAVPQA